MNRLILDGLCVLSDAVATLTFSLGHAELQNDSLYVIRGK